MGKIDEYEEYTPGDEKSLFVRKCVNLLDGMGDAWVYFYNRPVEGRGEVPMGDWVSYHQLSSGSQLSASE